MDMSVAIGRRGFNEQIIGANAQVFGQGGLSRLPRLLAWTRASLPTRQQDREASTEGDDRTPVVAGGSEQAVGQVRVRRSGRQRYHPVLASIAIRFSFLIGELHLGKLSETIVVHGNAPHNRPRSLMCYLIGNRAGFLCTKAPMLRVPDELSDHQLTSTSVPWPKSLGFGEAVISADRARRFDTLRGAPARPWASAIRTASIPHHRTPSAFRTLRTMPAESVGLALPAAGRFR